MPIITNGIDFDEEAHCYSVGGQGYPSVTQILKAAGMIDTSSPWYNDFTAGRGAAIHRATELWDRGELDEETVDERISNYVYAWKKFRLLKPLECVEIEKRFVDPVRGFAGTVDRVVDEKGRRGVLDIKTGQPEAWHALQTAAYAQGSLSLSRACVYLRSDGHFRLVTHKDRDDWDTFLAALRIHHWKKRNQNVRASNSGTRNG